MSQYGLRGMSRVLMDKLPSAQGGHPRASAQAPQTITPAQETRLDALLNILLRRHPSPRIGTMPKAMKHADSPHLTEPDKFHPYRGQVVSPLGMFMHSVSTELEAAYEIDPSGKSAEIAKIYGDMKAGLPAIMKVEDIWQNQQKTAQAMRRGPAHD